MTTLDAVVALPGVDEYMGEVEDRLAAAVGSHGGRVADVGANALAAGGKRLRPLLAFLCAPPDASAPDASVLQPWRRKWMDPDRGPAPPPSRLATTGSRPRTPPRKKSPAPKT